jgi:hypothetical protein
MKGEFVNKTDSFYEMFESSYCIDYHKLTCLPLETPYSIDLGAGDASFTCASVVDQWPKRSTELDAWAKRSFEPAVLPVQSMVEPEIVYAEKLTQISHVATELKNPEYTDFPSFEENMKNIAFYNEKLEQSGQKNRLYYIYNATINSLEYNWLRITSDQRPFEVTCINPCYYYHPMFWPYPSHTCNMVYDAAKFADYILEKNGLFKLGLTMQMKYYKENNVEENMRKFGDSLKFIQRIPIDNLCSGYKHQCSKEGDIIPKIEHFTFLYSYIRM